MGFIGPVGVRTYSFLRYLNELSEALAASPGIEVRYFARPSATRRERRPSRFVLRRIAGRIRQRLRRRMPRRVPPGLEAFEADVYHFTAPGDSWLIPHLPHDRAVVTVHDILAGAPWLDTEAPPETPPRLAPTSRYFRSLADAARIVCVSELARTEVLNHVDIPPERVTVIHNGLHERFRPLPEERLTRLRASLPSANTRILQLSSINQPRKNTGGVLRVLARLRDDRHDVRLLRVGAGFSDDDMRLAGELGVVDLIDELGRVDDETLVEAYNLADVMLFPSLHEGFGWPPLEAMACGTPVVASNIDACCEVIGDAGLLADPRDVTALANHVASLITDPQRAQEFRERGLARAGEFTWERAAAQFAEVYRSLV